MSWSLRTADGVELRVHGPDRPVRPVAIVLHGVGSTPDFALRCLADPLRGLGYDVVAPELRGHRASTALPDPADHSLDHHVADLSTLAHRVDARLVAGISLGAEVALRWLVRGGEVDGAVICLPGIAGPTSGAAAANRATAEVIERRGVDRVLAEMGEAPGALGWVVEEVRASWPQHDPASLVAALRAVAEYDALDAADLARLDVPIGVVGVTDDPAHPVEAADRLTAALRSGSSVHIALGDLADDRSVLGRVGLAALQRARSLPQRGPDGDAASRVRRAPAAPTEGVR